MAATGCLLPSLTPPCVYRVTTPPALQPKPWRLRHHRTINRADARGAQISRRTHAGQSHHMMRPNKGLCMRPTWADQTLYARGRDHQVRSPASVDPRLWRRRAAVASRRRLRRPHLRPRGNRCPLRHPPCSMVVVASRRRHPACRLFPPAFALGHSSPHCPPRARCVRPRPARLVINLPSPRPLLVHVISPRRRRPRPPSFS